MWVSVIVSIFIAGIIFEVVQIESMAAAPPVFCNSWAMLFLKLALVASIIFSEIMSVVMTPGSMFTIPLP